MSAESKDQVNGVTEELRNMGDLDKLVTASELICIATPLGGEDFFADLQHAFRQNGIETCIKNALLLSKRRKEHKDEQEQIPYMKKAQAHFERRISKALLNLHTDLKLSLVRPRSNTEAQELASKWDELSCYDQDIGSIRNLYSAKDLYEAIVSIRDPDHALSGLEEKWSAVKVPLSVPTFEKLEIYKDICNSDEPYLGIGPSLVQQANPNITLLNQRSALGARVVTEHDLLLSEEFVKSGCPSHLRGKLWKQVLQCTVGEKEKSYYQSRRQAVIETEYLTDKIIIKDIQLTASRDEHYFIFEDIIHQVALCFSRDSYIAQQLHAKFGSQKSQSAKAVVLENQLAGNSANSSPFPPSNCIPFYVAPLCYVYEEAEDVYYTLRAMYLRYWCKLHRISSQSQGLVCLSVVFERLLQELEPELWIHCLNSNIEPLRIALPWLVQAFSGFLLPEQLLYLWDLILGFDSLLLLPLLAASVFSLRRDNLHRVLSHDAAESVCADLSTIQVIPLLQMALSQKTTATPPNANV